jgi:cellulose synthase/poly-beta-1,6-N-acetylglucosamine synthase-like glycosyltransferase
MLLYQSITIFIFIYLAFNVLYLLLFALAGLFRKRSDYSSSADKSRIVVLIPTYKEDSIICDTAIKALEHNYPVELFDIVIIADQLHEATIKTLSKLPLKTLTVSFEKSTKAKSLKYALKQLPDNYYDIVLILDADNIMGSDCLEKVNHAFKKGYSIVQLHRTAKNRNTATAILDALSEEINNHIFRQGHRALGLSSALIGSGMAFDYSSFKSLMMETDIEENPGEDREIYLALLKQGKVCEYIEDALVYDEKVQVREVLEKQRTRWISAQMQYAKRFWIKEFIKTFRFNKHYFDYSLQTLLLPRLILLVVILIMLVLSILVGISFGSRAFPFPIVWLGLFMGSILSLVMGAYKYISFKEILSSLPSLPKTIWSLFKALFKSSTSQREFLHTPKDYNSIGH